MALSTGLGSALGVAAEVTYGTFVAPSSWFPAFSSEGVELKQEFDAIAGLRPDVLVQQDGLHLPTVSHGEGPVEITPISVGLVPLLTSLQGGTVTPTGSGTSKTRAYPIGLTVPDGRSLSLTARIPGVDGVAVAKRMTGVTVRSVTFKCDAKGHLTSSWTIHAQDIGLVTTPPTPTYPAAFEAFGFRGVAFTVDGAAPPQLVKDFEITITFGRDEDRFGLGGGGLPAAPLTNELIKITTAFTAEFAGLAEFAAFKAAQRRALVATFSGQNDIETGIKPSIAFEIPKFVVTDGPTPSASGPGTVTTKVQGEALGTGSASAPATITTVSTDVA